jgi:hypothetical protein
MAVLSTAIYFVLEIPSQICYNIPNNKTNGVNMKKSKLILTLFLSFFKIGAFTLAGDMPCSHFLKMNSLRKRVG